MRPLPSLWSLLWHQLLQLFPALQVSGPNGLLEHGEGSLDLGISIVPISSAYNCAPHHFMAGIFPSSRYSLLRKFLECKVPIAAMRMLLDVQTEEQLTQLLSFGNHCCLCLKAKSPSVNDRVWPRH